MLCKCSKAWHLQQGMHRSWDAFGDDDDGGDIDNDEDGDTNDVEDGDTDDDGITCPDSVLYVFYTMCRSL